MIFQLKDFDGPLDLLLHLIQQAKIDIKDIFISEITDQYVESVRNATDLDMEEASDFLVMAATLLEIKSRAMLPRPPKLEEGETDPAEELIRRLEEYRQIKQSVGDMRRFEEAAKLLYTKLPEDFPLPQQEVQWVGLTMEQLTEAFLRVMSRKPAEETAEINHYAPRNIHRDEHTVEYCMQNLQARLRVSGRIRFADAFGDAPTKEAVVTFFMAMLELLKLGEMHAEQSDVYGEILLVAGRAAPPEEE